MMVRLAFCLAASIVSYCCFSQRTLQRYRDELFSELTVVQDLTYSANVPQGQKEKRYKLDLYFASGDSTNERPLIIWMHGGGFKFGSKEAASNKIWNRNFARRGYLSAAINYRRSKRKTLRSFEALAKSCYDAMQDLTMAIQYLKSNRRLFPFDTSRIILAGNSAGGMIALQSVYSSYDAIARLVNYSDSNNKSTGYNLTNAVAVVNFWGAIFDPRWMQNTRVPIVSVHGRRDRIVPYSQNGSGLYGSSIIHQKADSLGISNELKTFDGYGHELQRHFIPILRSGRTKRRWMSAANFAADFLYREILQ